MDRDIQFSACPYTSLALAVFTRVCNRMVEEISASGVALEKLLIREKDVAALRELVAVLMRVMRRRKAMYESQGLVMQDDDRDELVRFIGSRIRTSKLSPDDDTRKSARRLAVAFSQYRYCYRLPYDQESHAIEGLVAVFGEDKFRADVERLDLVEDVERLAERNREFGELYVVRNRLQAEEDELPLAKDVRAEAMYLMSHMRAAIGVAYYNCEDAEEKAAIGEVAAGINRVLGEATTLHHRTHAKRKGNEDEAMEE